MNRTLGLRIRAEFVELGVEIALCKASGSRRI